MRLPFDQTAVDHQLVVKNHAHRKAIQARQIMHDISDSDQRKYPEKQAEVRDVSRQLSYIKLLPHRKAERCWVLNNEKNTIGFLPDMDCQKIAAESMDCRQIKSIYVLGMIWSLWRVSHLLAGSLPIVGGKS